MATLLGKEHFIWRGGGRVEAEQFLPFFSAALICRSFFFSRQLYMYIHSLLSQPTLHKFRVIDLSASSSSCCISGAPRAKRACGAPWVNKSTHPGKFGNHVTDRPTDRPSVRTTGTPMFTLTLSSYFGSPGES